MQQGTDVSLRLRLIRHPLVQILALAAAYYGSGRLGLLLAIPPGHATAVWPASGVALAAVLIGGYRLWPGVLLGSILVNYPIAVASVQQVSPALTLAAAMGTGAAVQALVGAWLLRRTRLYPDTLESDRKVVGLLGLGGPLSCLIAATFGVTALLISGAIDTASYLFSWWTWWVGDSIGVLIFTPLVLIWAGRPRGGWAHRRLSVGLPLIVSFLAVVSLFVWVSRRETARLEAEFGARTAALAHALERSVDRHLEVLHSISSLFETLPEVSAERFADFVAAPLSRHAGLRALEWAPRVGGSARQATAARMWEAGEAGFGVTEIGPEGRLRPAAAREEYFPIVYVEPRAGNESAIGFDLASDPIRAAALERARQSRTWVATAPLSLVQARGGKGFLVFAPVYDREGQGALAGFALAVYRADELLATALSGLDMEGLEVELVDLTDTADGELIASLPAVSATPTEVTGPFTAVTGIEVGGRAWQLRTRATALYMASHRSLQAWTVLAGGLMFAGGLGAFLLGVTGRSAKVGLLVADRTAKLSRSNVELAREIGERRRTQAALEESERRTRQVLDGALDAVVRMDGSGQVTDWNPQAESTFGWHREAALRAPLAELIIPAELREWFGADLARFAEKGDSELVNRRTELVALHRDGHTFPVELAITPLVRPDGLVFSAFLRDITERKRAESALEYRIEFERIITAISSRFLSLGPGELDPAIVEALEVVGGFTGSDRATLVEIEDDDRIVCTREWYRQDLTPHAEMLTGLRLSAFPWFSSQVENAQIIQIARAADLPDEAEPERMILARLGSESLISIPMLRRGALIGILSFASQRPRQVFDRPSIGLLRTVGEVFLSAVQQHETVEALRTSEGQHRELAAKLQEANAELESFSYSVAHDLRAPLRAMQGFATVLLEDHAEAFDDEGREYAGRIIGAAERMDRLIRDLLAYSRLTREDLHLETTSMEEIVDSAVEQLGGELQGRDVEFEIERPLPEVWAQPSILIQVVGNLLSNAAKFVPHGLTARVRVSGESANGKVKLWIEDNGIGIAPEHQPRIFRVFERLHGVETYPGTGIGLAIARKGVERMKGRIGVESALEKGSRFWIELRGAG